MKPWLPAICLFLLGAGAAPSLAADGATVTGRVKLSAIHALHQESADEDPSLNARMVFDATNPALRLYGWLEAQWDGTIRGNGRGEPGFESLAAVYQDNTPSLLFRELYVERHLAASDWRVGIQRFAWGRLDEFPVNDLFNPWDYRQFIVKPMEERKLGVPAISANLYGSDLNWQLVWAPWHVPYRLGAPDQRWSLLPGAKLFPGSADGEVVAREPELPAKTLANGAYGLRLQQSGEIDWGVNLFHGFDPRPIFRTTELRIVETAEGRRIDPGFVPAFHKITTLGTDGAAIIGDWALRGEAAYTAGRVFNIRPELWGYPQTLTPGTTPLPPVELTRDSLDYGVAGDYRPFEDALLTLQAQQTAIIHRPATLYDRDFETLLWANLRVGWLNQRLETAVNLAFNPEHGATMLRASVTYELSDFYKAGVTALLLDGPPPSIFGRYGMNDQIIFELVYSW